MPRDPSIPGGKKRPAKGAGWGGPAKGAGSRKPGPGRPPGVANGQGKAALARQALQAAAPMAVKTIINIARDPDDQRALAAAVAILNRVGMHEKSGVELTGADGAPMAIEWRVVSAGDPDA